MKNEREPQFTQVEENKIETVVSVLVDGGEDAIHRLQQTRYDFEKLEDAVSSRTGSLLDSKSVGGRTVKLANEAISRAEKILEERGEDTAIILKKTIEEKRSAINQ